MGISSPGLASTWTIDYTLAGTQAWLPTRRWTDLYVLTLLQATEIYVQPACAPCLTTLQQCASFLGLVEYTPVASHYTGVDGYIWTQ
jgi:hypothetical protein